jgi:hypothetical protein
MITKAEIEKAKKLCEEAADSGWEVSSGGKSVCNSKFVICETRAPYPRCFNDAKFIAASRDLVPKLIEAVEKLTNALEDISESTQWEEHDNPNRDNYEIPTEDAEKAQSYLNEVWGEDG